MPHAGRTLTENITGGHELYSKWRFPGTGTKQMYLYGGKRI